MSFQGAGWALDLTARDGVTASEKWVLVILADSAGMDNSVQMSCDTIAEVALMPAGKVSQVLKSLWEKGFILPVQERKDSWTLAVSPPRKIQA